MKKTFTLLAASTALLAPAVAMARPVTVNATMNANVGGGAYAAVYVTDAKGAYQGTLWVAGKKAKYFKHLPDWFRATRADPSQINGLTGASIGGGRTLTVTVDLADALIDAGYQIRVDASVEDGRDVGADAKVDLSSANNGKSVGGRGYVKSLKVNF